MNDIFITISGYEISFEQAKKMTAVIAEEGNEYMTLVSWCDRDKGVHSPCCLKCEFDDIPGWEMYGRNHGGRLRISVDDERFVFIYS